MVLTDSGAPQGTSLSLKCGLAAQVPQSKSLKAIHTSTSGTWLVKPHSQAFSYPFSTVSAPGWARGHSLRWCLNILVHSLPKLDLHPHCCSVSISRSSNWSWESFVPKVVWKTAKALCTWPKILFPSPVFRTTTMQERAKVKLKCLWNSKEHLSGLGRQTAYASECEMWLSLCYLALTGCVCY